MFDLKKPVPKEMYSSTAILKSAYSFLDRAYIHIADVDSNWVISFEPKELMADTLLLEFENELIAQSVRERVMQNTKAIRELLIARAVASSVVDEEDPVERMQEESYDIPAEELESIMTNWFDIHEKD